MLIIFLKEKHNIAIMNALSMITEDFQRMQVFSKIGQSLLQRLRQQMTEPSYASFFKPHVANGAAELYFTYLDQSFKTVIEIYFQQTKLPKTALLVTYHLPHFGKPEEIVSFSFSMDLQVHDVYTENDFAEPYLFEMHQNIKKTFSDNHTPLQLRLSTK